jgi:hypothetical protein
MGDVTLPAGSAPTPALSNGNGQHHAHGGHG